MKKILMAMLLMFSMNSFAQVVLEMSTATSLSPFATATRFLEYGSVTTLAPFAMTIATAQNRGVAGREQIKDELVELNDDMIAGRVTTIEEVRQPTLRELFEEIKADEEQMNNISSVLQMDSELQKISTAVTISLLLQ
ncbi:hypothetical protein [uncultured Chryseobacterium sp.]|uniref:hypothetical protein n=1 Tax=uncultured Chryseobacterium sp. TaxID=259322 RepID=UPI002589C496|nr:hypothetical protein [uncultured Chryseobacterium sp.]